MAGRIIHKRSLTANSVPPTSSLELGEIALNINDGKLFFRQSGSVGDITVSPLMTAQTSSMLQPYVLNSSTSSMLTPYVLTSVTSSMLQSYVLNSNTSSFVTNNQTSSFVFNSVTSSMLQSYTLNSVTSSMLQPYVLNSSTSSFVINSQTSSFVKNSQTSSMLANYAKTNASNTFSANQIIGSSNNITLNTNGDITLVNGAEQINISPTTNTVNAINSLSINSSNGAISINPNTNVGNVALYANTSGYVGIYNNSGPSYPLDVNGTTRSTLFLGPLQGTASYAGTASYVNTLNQTVSIFGNLNVYGTASFTQITGSILQAGTSTIVLNTNNPAIRFGGISVVDSGSFGVSSTGSLFWDSTNNRWIYSNPSGSTYDGGMLISGPRNTSGLGNEAGMDANFVAVGQGADHIRPGSIYNSGSITIVTGSLTVTAGVSGSFTGSLVGSLTGTASYATEALTAPNYVLNSVTSSMLQPYVLTSSTSSMTVATASYVRLSISSSYPISAAGSSIYSITPGGTSTGTNNTILLGANAGSGGTSIYNSNFIGYGAGLSATIANQSNFIGVYAGSEAARADNSNFIGMFAGYKAASASFSNLIGWQAGYTPDATLTIGSNNIIIGTNITLPVKAKDSINIGGIIFATGSYSSIVTLPFSGSQNIAKVGINNPLPQYTFDVSGSGNFSNGLTVTGSLIASIITGSLYGTSSWALNSISSSYAAVATLAPDYVLNSVTSSMLSPYVLNTNTSSFIVNSQTSSFVLNSVTSSMLSLYVLSSVTASTLTNYVLNSVTSSMLTPYVLTSVTASMLAPYVLNSVTSSMSVATASYISPTFISASAAASGFGAGGGSGAGFPYSGSAAITGSLLVSGSGLTTIGNQTISGSILVNSQNVTAGQFVGNQNGYVEFSLRNTNTGNSASGDFAIYADSGTVTDKYIDMGINNSGMSPTYYYAGANFGGPLDAYLYNVGGNLRIGNANASSPSQSFHLFSNPTATPNITITGSRVGINDIIPSYTLDVSGSGNFTNGLTVTGSLIATSSWANNAVTASYVTGIYSFNYTASYTAATSWTVNHNLGTKSVLIQAYDSSDNQIVPKAVTLNNANTATISFNTPESGYAIASVGGALNFATASVANIALSANAISTLNQSVLITGSATIGVTSAGASENTLTLGARDNGSEGGQIGFNAPGGTYTSASFIDNYQNQFRILTGTNAGSNAELVKLDLKSGNMTLNAGSVVMISRPAFRVTGSSITGIAATTTITSTQGAVVEYNQGGYYNNTTGIFTAPVAGLYHVYFNARTQTAGSQQVIIYKNSSINLMWETNANTGHFGVSGIVNLAVNDTLKATVSVGTIQFDSNDSWGAAFIG